MLGPESLRLTAALTHTLPSVTAVLRLDHGPEVVVGSDRRCLPDLSPCAMRRLVAEHRAGGGPHLSWLTSVEAVELGGPDVTAVVEDAVCVGGRDAPVMGFATLLDPLTTRAVLRDTGRDLLAADEVPADLLRRLRASTFHDELLDVTTVVVARPEDDPADGTRTVVTAAARACRVAELLESVAAHR